MRPSGYDGWSFYVHQAVVVAAERDEPVWIGRGQDANGARAAFGDPSAKLSETTDIVVEGLNAAIDAVEPGVTCEEVEAAWRDVITSYGIEKEEQIATLWARATRRTGASTREHPSSDKTELKEGMTIYMIPGIWQDDVGTGLSETFHVTSDGAEVVADFRGNCSRRADFPRELFSTR